MHPILLRLTLPLWLAQAASGALRLGLVALAVRAGWRSAPPGGNRWRRAVEFGVAAFIAEVALYSQAIDVMPMPAPRDASAELVIRSYGLLVAVGCLAAVLFIAWFLPRNFEAAEAGRFRTHFVELMLLIFVGGLVGAWLLFRLVNWRDYLNGNWKAIFNSGGLVYYGASLASWAVTFWFVRRHQISIWRTADLGFITSLGQGIGRLACFAAGCCWGKFVPPTFPLAVNFPGPAAPVPGGSAIDTTSVVFYSQRTDQRWIAEATGEVTAHAAPGLARVSDWALAHGHSLPVHPVQLYEAAAQLVLFCLIWAIHRRRKFDGQMFGLWAMGYATVRGTVELWRGDLERGTIHGLVNAIPAEAWYNISTSQLISAGAFAVGAAVVLYRYNASRSHSRVEVAP